MASTLPAVLALEDAAELLLVTPEQLRTELEAGRLRGRSIAGEWRITETALLEYLGEKSTPSLPQTDSSTDNAGWTWKRLYDFKHKWPKHRTDTEENIENYDLAFQSVATCGGRKVKIVVAFTYREAYGQNRRKVVGFVDGYPTVEGVGADDFDTSHRLVSPIRLADRTELKPGLPIPPEYADMPTVEFKQLVTGPYSRNCIAVVITEDDARIEDGLNIMARHTLIRARCYRRDWPLTSIREQETKVKSNNHAAIVYRHLVNNIVPRRSPTTYEDVCAVIGLSLDEAWNYIPRVLDQIFVACDDKKLPPLTSIVVGQGTIRGRHGMPGSGYFVAEAVSPNKSRRMRTLGIEAFHPDSGLTADEKGILRGEFVQMVHAHQDSVWFFGNWPDNL